jgi:hypothetical protein
LTPTHELLTAVSNARTLYGADQPYRLKHNGHKKPWTVLFEDKMTGSGWEVAFAGSFHECLSFIREYEMGPDLAF